MSEDTTTTPPVDPAILAAQQMGEPPAFFTGLGRRKTAVARVRLRPNGTGKFTCNKKRNLEEYFQREADRLAVLSPLAIVGAEKKFDIYLTCTGGGTAGQAGAARMGIARCLSKVSAEYLGTLKAHGFLTRDAREKERRKYGRRGARASYQFSKR